MRVLLGLAMFAVMGLVTGATADDKKDVKIDGKKLIGKWEPTDKKGGPGVIEFTKDGKLIVSGDLGGKELKIEGTYKLDGNKLTLAMKFMDNDIKETVTLTKLTDEEMEGEDSKGKKETFKRIKAK